MITPIDASNSSYCVFTSSHVGHVLDLNISHYFNPYTSKHDYSSFTSQRNVIGN